MGPEKRKQNRVTGKTNALEKRKEDKRGEGVVKYQFASVRWKHGRSKEANGNHVNKGSD